MPSPPVRVGIATIGIVAVLAFKELVFDPHLRPLLEQALERRRQEQRLADKDREWDFSVSADGEPEFVEHKKKGDPSSSGIPDESQPHAQGTSVQAGSSDVSESVVSDPGPKPEILFDAASAKSVSTTSMSSSVTSLNSSQLASSVSSDLHSSSYVFPSNDDGEVSDNADIQSISAVGDSTTSEMSWSEADDISEGDGTRVPENKL